MELSESTSHNEGASSSYASGTTIPTNSTNNHNTSLGEYTNNNVNNIPTGINTQYGTIPHSVTATNQRIQLPDEVCHFIQLKQKLRELNNRRNDIHSEIKLYKPFIYTYLQQYKKIDLCEPINVVHRKRYGQAGTLYIRKRKKPTYISIPKLKMALQSFGNQYSNLVQGTSIPPHQFLKALMDFFQAEFPYTPYEDVERTYDDSTNMRNMNMTA